MLKPKTLFKMMLDVIMLVLFAELMFCYSLSPLFHEVVGIGIAALFAVHVAVNWKPVRAMMKSSEEGRLSIGKTALLVSDIILPFCMAATIVTGMLIATELWWGPGNEVVMLIHNLTAYVCLAILAIHTALHVKYLAACCKQLLSGSAFQKAANCIGAAAIVFSLFGANVTTGLMDIQSSISAVSSSAQASASDGTTAIDSSSAAAGDGTTDALSSSAGTTTQSHIRTSMVATVNDTSSGSTDTSESSVSSSDGSDGSDDGTSVSEGSSSSADDTSSTPTYCSMCGKHCPITNLGCGRGTAWAQQQGLI